MDPYASKTRPTAELAKFQKLHGPPPRLTLRTITYLVDDSNHSETN